MTFLLAIVGIVALLYVLHVVALFAERRGWIYYRTRRPRVRTLGLLEELVDPSVEYRVAEETSQAIRGDRSEQGEGLGGDDESDGP